jgi:hypothetical protein
VIYYANHGEQWKNHGWFLVYKSICEWNLFDRGVYCGTFIRMDVSDSSILSAYGRIGVP